MSESHTPGPWDIELSPKRIRTIHINAPTWVRMADVYQTPLTIEEGIANAHLIAAAPDQNSALALVLPFLIEEQQVLERSYMPEPDDEESVGLERIALLIKVVSEALKKAGIE